jgi:hypothetical protein
VNITILYTERHDVKFNEFPAKELRVYHALRISFSYQLFHMGYCHKPKRDVTDLS